MIILNSKHHCGHGSSLFTPYFVFDSILEMVGTVYIKIVFYCTKWITCSYITGGYHNQKYLNINFVCENLYQALHFHQAKKLFDQNLEKLHFSVRRKPA